MESNLPPGVSEFMLPCNRPEDEEVELSVVLTVGQIEDLQCECDNQADKEPAMRSPVWYALDDLVSQIKGQMERHKHFWFLKYVNVDGVDCASGLACNCGAYIPQDFLDDLVNKAQDLIPLIIKSLTLPGKDNHGLHEK